MYGSALPKVVKLFAQTKICFHNVVLPGEFLEGVLVLGEVRHRPVLERDVYLVDILGVGAGQRGGGPPMECPVEGQDR
jgi:hypothetical protein